MLTQKIPFEDIFKNIVSIVHQRTPTYMPITWCEYLSCREGNSQESKRVYTLLKRSVARESLERLQNILKHLEWSRTRKSLLNFMSASRRDSSQLGIEVCSLYLTELAMIEIARGRRIPLAFHVMQCRYRNEQIEVVKWHLKCFLYSRKSKRFESVDSLGPNRLVIGVENIWYEGSEANLNYGDEFLEREFNLENYIETWKGHEELTSRLEDLKCMFLDRVIEEKPVGFTFPGSIEYLQLKELLGSRPDASEVLGKIKRMSFMFCSHFYPSTWRAETEFSRRLNGFEWEPIRVEPQSRVFSKDESLNKRLWERKSQVRRRSRKMSFKNYK